MDNEVTKRSYEELVRRLERVSRYQDAAIISTLITVILVNSGLGQVLFSSLSIVLALTGLLSVIASLCVEGKIALRIVKTLSWTGIGGLTSFLKGLNFLTLLACLSSVVFLIINVVKGG